MSQQEMPGNFITAIITFLPDVTVMIYGPARIAVAFGELIVATNSPGYGYEKRQSIEFGLQRWNALLQPFPDKRTVFTAHIRTAENQPVRIAIAAYNNVDGMFAHSLCSNQS